MGEINANDITSITGAKSFGKASNRLIKHLLTDSRKLLSPEDTLFFAIKTHTNDGHHYIKDLYTNGVRAFLVESLPKVSLCPEAMFFQTNDVVGSLQSIAAHHRGKFSYPVIAIAGSNGKTIVKEWLYHLLFPFYKIVRSPRSYNSQLGVPLSVWQMDAEDQLGIFEAGISSTHEMSKLEKVIRPGIGLFTNLGEAHAEGFLDNKEKLQEKLSLFRNSEIIIYSKDQANVDVYIDDFIKLHPSKKIITWGINQQADILINEIKSKNGYTDINVGFQGKQFSFSIPFTDRLAIENAMHCFAVCCALGREENILERMRELPSLSMRLEIKEGQSGSIIINDSYNADLTGVLSAIEFLSTHKPEASKAVILSDISGISNNIETVYNELANFLTTKKIQTLYAVGPVFMAHSKYFQKNGLESHYFNTTEELLKYLQPSYFKGQVVLVKGARDYNFEKVSLLLETKIHKTRLEVNLSTIAHNLRQIRSLLKPTTKIMAMVKAFSYGAGSFEIANLLQSNRVDYIAVAYADEGIELRKAGIHLPIMVMNVETDGFSTMLEYNLEPEVYSFELAVKLNNFLEKEGILYFPIHLKVDTGLHRLGIEKNQIKNIISVFSQNRIIVKSIFTHLVASEDSMHDDFTQHQLNLFDSIYDELLDLLSYAPIRHASNTSAIIRHPRAMYEMVRVGIGLYGIHSSKEQVPLIEAVELKTTIAQIRFVKKGESVGYGRKSILKKDSHVATIRIGYADGFPRKLGNGNGAVMIKQKLYPTIGNICMDMSMIDIGSEHDIQVDDEVIIFGKDHSLNVLSNNADTIPYQIMTGISNRVPRVYLSE